MNIEIERKYLIKMPDICVLSKKYNIYEKSILQTYLKCDSGTRRVRKVTADGCSKYILTEKKRITNISCFEDEHEISFDEYLHMLNEADVSRAPVNKIRYVIEFKGHNIEIDKYDFWNNFATLEVELQSENEAFEIPQEICIIKEVTDDKRFKNVNLAKVHNFDGLC